MNMQVPPPFFSVRRARVLSVFASLLAMTALLVACTAQEPDEGPAYRSEKGYRIALPSQWLAVSRLDAGQKEIPLTMDNPRTRSLFTPEFLKALNEKARASGVDLFLNLETSDETFIESINVQSAGGSIAVDASEVRHACAETERQLSALYREPVRISTCRAFKTRRMPAILMEYQVEKPALAYVQYLIQLRTDRYIVMTLTCRPQNLAKLRGELESMIATFRPA